MMESKLITYKGRTRRLWNVNITTPIELSKIRTALFHKNTELNKYVTEFSIKIYNQMLAGNRRCELNIALYEPMDTATTESENKKNTKLAKTTSNIIGAAVVAPIYPYNKLAGGGCWVGC
ncbi:hypothetical protein HWV03_04470 [Moritella sp. 36]|uniref:hypothetical protein n=1 Tax=Moritella sp. 36 TaxID=2746233 RepID=UPI001BA80E8D|nr:hypothetical protein [Moritella sp. 36]QUM88133.1 hypothetical protein HWV03_04470 [Moritella sp. 36]